MSERGRSELFFVLGEAHICTHVEEEEEEKRRRKKASPPLGTRLLKEEEEGLLSVGVRSKGFFPFSPSPAQPRKRPSHFPLSLVFPLCPKTVTQVQERRRAVPHLAPPTTTVNSPRDFAAGKQCEKSASVFLRSFEKVRRTHFYFRFNYFLRLRKF